jgi:hypothetical protein
LLSNTNWRRISLVYIDEDLVEQYIDGKTTIFCTHWKDIDYYNDLVFHKKFLVEQIYVIQLEKNAKNVEHIQSWVCWGNSHTQQQEQAQQRDHTQHSSTKFEEYTITSILSR